MFSRVFIYSYANYSDELLSDGSGLVALADGGRLYRHLAWTALVLDGNDASVLLLVMRQPSRTVALPLTATPHLQRRTVVSVSVASPGRVHLDPADHGVLDGAAVDDRGAAHVYGGQIAVVDDGVLQQQLGALVDAHLPAQVAARHSRRALLHAHGAVALRGAVHDTCSITTPSTLAQDAAGRFDILLLRRPPS